MVLTRVSNDTVSLFAHKQRMRPDQDGDIQPSVPVVAMDRHITYKQQVTLVTWMVSAASSKFVAIDELFSLLQYGRTFTFTIHVVARLEANDSMR